MALTTNKLIRQVDTPVWKWCRFAPAVSAAFSCSTTAENSISHESHGRYIYYLITAALFYKYDTWNDTYIQLSIPTIAPTTWASMKFSSDYGYEGAVLSATATTITAAAYNGQVLKGYDIKIVSGTGAGQRRKITAVADPVVAQTGIMTAISAGLTFTDSTSTAAINQYAGYQFRVIYGAGIGAVRKILHHTATVFTYADTGGYEIDYNTNPAAPATAFVAQAAGVGSIYQIESSVITVDTAWDVTPDSSSRFIVESGGIFLFSSSASIPFYTVQFYDVAADTWYIRSATSALLNVAATDGAIEKPNLNATLWEKGTATSGTITTLTDSTKNWTTNEWAGYYVRFYSGTKPSSGADQIRLIVSNTATVLTWAGSITTPADTTTLYRIEGFGGGVATAATSTTLTDTNAPAASWTTNRWANYMVEIISGTGIGQRRRIASNTATALTLYAENAWTTTPDTTSGYIIVGDYDKIFFAMGVQSAIIGYSIPSDMCFLGRNFASGSPAQGTVTLCNSSGVLSRRDQAISTITFSTTTATVTTVNAHRLKVGDYIKIQGATGGDAATYNITTTVVSVTSATVFTYTMGGTPSGNATFTGFSTSTLTDASQNWTVNAWANYIVYYAAANPVAATGSLISVGMEISSNTATTLTLKTATTLPVNGTGRYVICERAGYGASTSGIATGAGQTTTAIADSSQTWATNIFTGKRVKKTAGAGQSDIEGIVSSNTSTVLTITVAGTLPVAASTSYTVYDEVTRGLATCMKWGFGTSDANMKGKFIFSAKGSAALGFDRFNITTNRWEPMSITPQIETLTTGAQYAYDGGDRLYLNVSATTQRIYYLDVVENTLEAAGQYPYTAGTAIVGNKMEIFTTVDGLKWLWINRPSNLESFKALLFT